MQSSVFKHIRWAQTPFPFSSNHHHHHPRTPSLTLLLFPQIITLVNGRNKGRVLRKQSYSCGQFGISSSASRSIGAMPISSIATVSGGGDAIGALRNFKLNESTFLASLMPKKEIGADRFIEAHPEYDGRGVIIAIFGINSGMDPAAAGLQVTTDGKPKVLDVIDCTGSGDIDTSKVVKADADGCIRGASGQLQNELLWLSILPGKTLLESGMWVKERKKTWDEKNQEEIAKAVKHLCEFDQKHPKSEDVNLKRIREDLQNKVDILRKQADNYDDKGPVIDAVVWYDGELWRAALDTQNLEDNPECGKLADFVPLTNYRIERKFGVFSTVDACTAVLNIYDEGNILSIVTDSSPHGTHVSGIATAFHREEPLLNGIAPGAQIISCKIGDSRLGSMETGTGLTRALIAAVEHKCDLINMSYGEPALLPDYGRFVDLVNEVVDKHRITFISSAGNSGPALSTVGAPGGTSTNIIGVGAYVSPAMAAGAHSVVEAPAEGLEYTWSSRGPTVDGDLGVSVSAPGGAVAPVPTWTLQNRMLMNGTSMASPSACGGAALLISAMKAEGITVSPYTVRQALENTSLYVGECLADKLTTGQGLMQVDRAYEYVCQSRDIPIFQYNIKVNQSGKSTPISRGIYLREAVACQQSSEWAVQVEPKFHEGASNLEELVPFEECIELYSTDKTVVKPPEYILLTHNGRSFNLVVDPSKLSVGLHYFEVYGVDCKAPWRGPVFRIPITITKPMIVENRPPQASFLRMSFLPGHIERRFIEVPLGASWAEATVRVSEFDTTRRFFLDTLQICPLRRPIKWESVATFSSPGAKTFSFRVVSGQTMELAVAQFWSSGLGSRDTTIVDFEISFHGIDVTKEEIILDGSDAPVRIDTETLLASEKLSPVALLNKLRVPYRPVDSKLITLTGTRDKLPSGKQTLALTLTYKFKLEDGAEVKPQVPLLNNRIYDTKFESQFFMISDANKRVYSVGDVYPAASKLPKGDYTLQLYLRHDNVQYLEKLKQLVLFIEKTLEDKDVIRLNFFSEPDGPIMGNGSYKSSELVPGYAYISKEEGSNILGSPPQKTSSLRLLSGQEAGKSGQKSPVSYPISYVVPPNKVDEDKQKGSSASSTKSVSERLEEEVRDAKIKILGSLKQDTEEERSEWKKLSDALKTEYPQHTPLLSKILEGLRSRSKIDDKIKHSQEVIATADEVISSVDKDELAKFFSYKPDPEDEEAEKMKKKMETTRDQLAEALYSKGLALSEIESLKQNGDKTETVAVAVAEGTIDEWTDVRKEASEESGSKQDSFEDTFKELQKWVDVKSSKFGTLYVLREKRRGRLGTALKVLNDMIQEDGDPPKKKLFEMKLSLLEEIGWTHLTAYEKQWMHVRFPSSLPLF
uniref:tripeptidyl-peptidase II n=1 Tax=Linum usitatissimum TaxID=4006 RepID=A0A172MLF6_LINUS|nr:hypothetical protein [Linum usitatissimum]